RGVLCRREPAGAGVSRGGRGPAMTPRTSVRYLPWMAQDAALGPGLAALAVAILFTFVASRLPTRALSRSPEEFLAGVVAQFDWIVILIATGGIVSGDLKKGYYRSLFAQPIDPGLYYLQKWVVGSVAVALLVPLVALGLWATMGKFPF